MSGDAVGEHDAESEYEQYGIRADRSGKQEIEVHEEAEECGDAGAEPDDKPEADHDLADSDDI